MESEARRRQWIGTISVILLGLVCLAILRPFIASITWAAILTFATWPIYGRLLRRLNHKRGIAAFFMTFFIAVLVVAPITIVSLSLVNDFTSGMGTIQQILNEGAPDPPAWVKRIPLLGSHLQSYWQDLAHNGGKLVDLLKDWLTRWRGWFVARGLDVGQGVLNLLFTVFVAFFLYRDGLGIVEGFRSILTRFVGDRGHQLFDVMAGTIKGVIYGIVGTALVQAILAGIGFLIVRMPVPLPLLLAVATFFLSLIPIGPPLIWFPLAIWLFYKKSIGWGIFMLIYGTFVISGVDNVVKPYLISKGSNLPFILVFFGILGGVINFGFLGIFVGPTLLAVGYTLIQPWCYHVLEDRDE